MYWNLRKVTTHVLLFNPEDLKETTLTLTIVIKSLLYVQVLRIIVYKYHDYTLLVRSGFIYILFKTFRGCAVSPVCQISLHYVNKLIINCLRVMK